MIKLSVDNFESYMIRKAKAKGGIYENFGQRELRELEDRCPDWYGEDRETMKRIDMLRTWAENYTGES